MLVIPAIDILGGKCVRLRQGSFQDISIFSDDPVEMAKLWIDQGARDLHLVDLEGARQGSPQSFDLLRAISSLGVPVQIGGGIRSLEDIAGALEAGATRVVIGTRAATDPAFAMEIIQAFGQQVVIGIDAREGIVAIHGWQELLPDTTTAVKLAKEMEALGAARIIFTDIARDGMLTGPNYDSIAQMRAAVSIPIIASGGITKLEDLRQLKKLGVEGCIIGRALYTGEIKLAEAIAVFEERQ
jgi:phosphoribosylformimino-5-aminoimidazole carboxamide ribotide isomerase